MKYRPSFGADAPKWDLSFIRLLKIQIITQELVFVIGEAFFGQVINLSGEGFTKNEYKLLGYNLNFIPTPEKLNKKEIMENINNFNRRVKLKSHFGETPPKEGLYFKSNSKWEPPNPQKRP